MRLLAVALASAIVATSVTAQTVHTAPARSGGAARPAVAGIAPPPPVIVVPGGGFGNQIYPSGMSYYSNFPIVVLPDGRVFADFGRGFERIARTCNVANYVVAPMMTTGQPTVVQPVVVQPSIGVAQPLPYTPPVPNQQTASQQMVYQSNGQALAAQSTVVNPYSCWGHDGRGQVFIGRP